jgi:hypothetical protein
MMGMEISQNMQSDLATKQDTIVATCWIFVGLYISMGIIVTLIYYFGFLHCY